MPRVLHILPSLLLTLITCLAASLASAEVSRPNVLFIAVDDLKPVTGAYGDPFAITPNMDRLASQGRLFEKAYCQYAVCAPSRASLLTGLRPDSTEVLDLSTPVRKHIPDIITLPQHFGNEGYNVAAIGKLFHGGNSASQDNELSFQGNWKYTPGSHKSYYEPGKSEQEDAHIASGKPFWEARVSLTDRGAIDEDEAKDGRMTTEALKMMNQLSEERDKTGEPFFLAVGYLKPHLPFAAPEKYWALYDDTDFGYSDYRGSRQIPEGSEPWTPPTVNTELSAYNDFPKGGIKDPAFAANLVQGYYACVSYVDALIGKLLDELEALGQSKDTIIVLWGDHGWHLGDHDGFWAKHSNFEQATRSPLIIVYPGISNPGMPTEHVVEFVDIYPTLCDLAGLPRPNQPAGLELQGSSMAGILADDNAPWNDLAFSQMISHRGLMGHSIRDPRYRLTVWYERDNVKDDTTQTDTIALVELYDYQADPGEKASYYGQEDYKPIAEKLMALLNAGTGWRQTETM